MDGEKFSNIFTSLEIMNEWKDKIMPLIPDISVEEYSSLMGRYAESHIRYNGRYQFMCGFFTIMKESQEKLRLKLRVNTILRTLDEDAALSGDEVITNNAANPDTAPSTVDYAPLGYVNSQVAQKGNIGKVKGLYEWKHSVGGQAYTEFLDTFKNLFRVILSKREEWLYE